ncbi:MAG: trigger factor [Chthoniobacterales bacterium]|nr:trigger factor [Chthoniobacterales bacterium]
MNVVCDPQPNCIVHLQVELPADQVTREWQSIAKDFQRLARIPGYRPGKAPQSLIDTRFARDIREELEKKLLNESLSEAIKQKNLRCLSVEKVEDVQIGEDKTMRYRASVITAPEFELPDYSSITIDLAKRTVSDEDVQKWLEQLREPHATFEAVENRPVAMGDYAVMTYEGKRGDQLLSEALPKAPAQLQGRRNAWIFMDEGTLVPGFAKAVEGMAINDERSFTLDVPSDFPLEDLRGSQVSYAVTLHGINVKQLPPFDDALAEKIESGKTLESLRTEVREALEQMAESEFLNGKRNAALKQLLSSVQCELPAQSVQQETSTLLREIVQENHARGVSDEELRANQDEIVGIAQQNATDRVRTNFLLLRIAEKENLEATDTDMVMVISEMARRHEIPVKKLIKELQARDGLGGVRERVLIRKALDLIAANVTVREPADTPAQS